MTLEEAERRAGIPVVSEGMHVILAGLLARFADSGVEDGRDGVFRAFAELHTP